MDENLAAIYGTNEIDDVDMEKAAAAELLVKLAEEEGIDLDDLSDEELGELAAQFMDGDEDGEDDEETEKLAEADYLGRVMAHAYVQELRDLEKYAAEEIAGPTTKTSKGGRSRKKAPPGLFARMGGWFKKRPEAYKELGRSIRGLFTGKLTEKQRKKLPFSGRVKALGRGLWGVAPEIGTAAGITGAALLARHLRREKEKRSSALDALAEQRALEMLAESGWLEQEKTASSAINQLVEYEALKKLEAMGYPVVWNV